MPITTTPSGGPQGDFSTYTPISAYTVSGTTTNTMTFTNIPTTYTDLVLVVHSRLITNPAILLGQFNGDTGGNYSSTSFGGDGASLASNRATSSTAMYFSAYGHQNTSWSTYTFHIMNYANPNINKTVLRRASNTGYGLDMGSNLWRSKAPITSITVLLDRAEYWTAGSTITLYGIKAAAPAPKATGGDIINTDGTYWYHAFKTTGILDVRQSMTADILVVAGGGGGSGWDFAGGGGGAGGVLAFNQTLTLAPYPCVVGSGGVGTRTNYQLGTNGADSRFGSLTLVKGGGGGGASNNSNSTGATGGSGGGGGAGGTALGGSPTSGQGYAGGNGISNTQKYPGGGGGGAGGAGSNSPNSATGGAGGIGTTNVTNWGALTAALTATGLGASNYLAGGGGGGVYAQYGGGASGGAGGTGGGGTGGVGAGSTASTSGVANTGGGGGGDGGGTNGSNGGSGVIIVRYPV